MVRILPSPPTFSLNIGSQGSLSNHQIGIATTFQGEGIVPEGARPKVVGRTYSTRPFIANDYAQICEVHNSIYPESLLTPDEVRFGDEHCDPRCRRRRWVIEGGGLILGYGEYRQTPDTYDPREFLVNVSVRPERQGEGIGKALYDSVLESLESLNPISVRTVVRDDMKRGLRFLEERGFRSDACRWELRLNPASCDLSPYRPLQERLAEQGVEIKTLRELETDANRDRKIYELETEITRDVPFPEPQTPLSYDYFVKRRLSHPRTLPDGFFVALHNGEYVGLSDLWSRKRDSSLSIQVTGVRRAYRHMGIATALKLRAIAYAKDQGHTSIVTWNEINNRSIFLINQRFGFVTQYTQIGMVKFF